LRRRTKIGERGQKGIKRCKVKGLTEDQNRLEVHALGGGAGGREKLPEFRTSVSWEGPSSQIAGGQETHSKTITKKGRRGSAKRKKGQGENGAGEIKVGGR